MKNRKNNKGFSLVELIVVVAIMAVLVGVLAPAYLKYVESSREKKDANNLEEVRHAVEIALAEETIFTATTDDCEIEINTSTGAISAPATNGAPAVLVNEVKAVAGDAVKLASDKYTAQATWTITVDLTGGVDVTANWPS